MTKCVLSSGHTVVLFGVAVETGASSATLDQIQAIGQFVEKIAFDSPPTSLWHQDLLSDLTCWEIRLANANKTHQSICLVNNDFGRQAETALEKWKALGPLKYSDTGSTLAAQAGQYSLILRRDTVTLPLTSRLWNTAGYRNFFHVEISRLAGRAMGEIHERSR